jgi:hypothetical protein
VAIEYFVMVAIAFLLHPRAQIRAAIIHADIAMVCVNKSLSLLLRFCLNVPRMTRHSTNTKASESDALLNPYSRR